MINIFTITLDGLPWLANHLREFNQLSEPWRWIICEGVAAPVKCTGWCKPMAPRLSTDGTHEYLVELAAHHPNVTHIYRPLWEGKVEMVNAAVREFTEHGLLMQIDSDELWTAEQIMRLKALFDYNRANRSAYFWCDYYLGPNIKIVSKGDFYGNRRGEWMRAWRFAPGQAFECHEPVPILDNVHYSRGAAIPREITETHGLTFQHYAYATEKQVAFKEAYYGYTGAVEQWKRLQANKQWPARVADFLPWVHGEAMADLVCK